MIATKLLDWKIRVGHDEAYYEADGVALMPTEEFNPMENIEDAHAIWASLVIQDWIVSTFWGPVDTFTVYMIKIDDLKNETGESISALGKNFCEAICLAALKAIK